MNTENNLINTIPFIKGRYIVLDTETTGLDFKIDHLISISAVEIIDGMITGSQFNSYVRSRDYKTPKQKSENNQFYYVEDYSREIYNIEKHTLKNFLNFVGDSLIFAHNAIFDARFIDFELVKWGLDRIPFQRFRCTLQMAKKRLSLKNNGHTLENICKHFEFNSNKKDFHHGLFDAFMCARIVCKLLIIRNVEDKGLDEDRENDIKINEVKDMKSFFNDDLNLIMKSVIMTPNLNLQNENNDEMYVDNEMPNKLNNDIYNFQSFSDKFEDMKLSESEKINKISYNNDFRDDNNNCNFKNKIIKDNNNNNNSSILIFDKENKKENLNEGNNLNENDNQLKEKRIKLLMKNYYIKNMNK